MFTKSTTMTLVLATSLAAFAPPPSEATDLTIGIAGGGPSALSLRIAEAAGFYEKEGLNVQVVSMEGGTRGVQVLLSGKIEVLTAGLGPVLQANRQGADVRMIAVTRNSIPYVIFSLPHVKTGADLRGGTISISTFGSEPDIAVTLALRQLGLSRKDVIIVQMGDNSKRLNALSAGYITATPLAEPNIMLARQRGLNPLVDLAASKIPWIFTGVVLRRSYLNSQRDVVTKLLRATIEAGYFALSHESKAKELIAVIFRTSDVTVINSLYNDFQQSPRIAEVLREDAESVINEVQATGISLGSKNLDDHIDGSIFQSLKQEGFVDAMKRKYNLPEK
jgi:NitT/TauT family transport system substrate-binding protein